MKIIPVLVDEMKPGKASTDIQQLCADVIAHILEHLYHHNKSNIGSNAMALVYSSKLIYNEHYYSDVRILSYRFF